MDNETLDKWFERLESLSEKIKEKYQKVLNSNFIQKLNNLPTKKKLYVALIAFAVVYGIWYVIAFPYIREAATYNKLTGLDASWWDAIWVELRVDCKPINQ